MVFIPKLLHLAALTLWMGQTFANSVELESKDSVEIPTKDPLNLKVGDNVVNRDQFKQDLCVQYQDGSEDMDRWRLSAFVHPTIDDLTQTVRFPQFTPYFVLQDNTCEIRGLWTAPNETDYVEAASWTIHHEAFPSGLSIAIPEFHFEYQMAWYDFYTELVWKFTYGEETYDDYGKDGIMGDWLDGTRVYVAGSTFPLYDNKDYLKTLVGVVEVIQDAASSRLATMTQTTLITTGESARPT